jgi:hypothetical protein
MLQIATSATSTRWPPWHQRPAGDVEDARGHFQGEDADLAPHPDPLPAFVFSEIERFAGNSRSDWFWLCSNGFRHRP